MKWESVINIGNLLHRVIFKRADGAMEGLGISKTGRGQLYFAGRIYCAVECLCVYSCVFCNLNCVPALSP